MAVRNLVAHPVPFEPVSLALPILPALAESFEARQHPILVSRRDGMPQVMHLRFPRVTFYEYYIVQGPNEKNAITLACILPRRFQL